MLAAPRIFIPATALISTDGLDAATADDAFFVIGAPGRYDLAGYLVPLTEMEPRGIPRKVARESAMIASLRTSEHLILLDHGEGLWELLVQTGQGLPDTYTFRVHAASSRPPQP